jgi:hypothetical protein
MAGLAVGSVVVIWIDERERMRGRRENEDVIP